MSKPIAIIFGAGKNIGATTARAFSNKGYRVAQVARSLNTSDSNDESLSITADLSKVGSVNDVFTQVRKAWGEPSLIYYNAAVASPTEASNPFTLSEEDFTRDLAINTTSVYAALKEAVTSFQALPDSITKVFFYTGNKLATPGFVLPSLFTLGVGKTATSHLVEVASVAYKDAGYKFYFIDERTEDGGPQYKVSGEGHADFAVSLLEGRGGEVPWYATFVKGKGYTKF
ncbi:hypothetical protein ABW20_dc0109829 [Dactylellina cionopaga]|nr:hypothetical protein ABW20_dc0109829 [Dactylellina cionopaga]